MDNHEHTVQSVPDYEHPKRSAENQARYEYRAWGFLRRTNKETVHDVTQRDVDIFRQTATAELAPETIENYIKAVQILSGRKFKGKKLKKKPSRPKLIPLHDLSKVFGIARDRKNSWFCRFLKFAYITGLRHHDLTGLRRDQITEDAIEVIAGKTGKLHIIPRHPILKWRMPDSDRPLYRNQQTVRKKLRHYCEAGRVPYFTPQMIRRTAATQYERAFPGAGAVLLGHSLGSVTWQYYLDQYEILRAAQQRLEIPRSMLPQGEMWQQRADEKELVSNFRKIPAAERKTILDLIAKYSR